MILQPDVCYAGGITELQGPCSLAASLQVAASIPNFLIQERGDDEHTNLLAKPFGARRLET